MQDMGERPDGDLRSYRCEWQLRTDQLPMDNMGNAMEESQIIYSLDLQEELLSHLVIPESWAVIHGEEFSSDLIQDEFVTAIFNWQRQHIREYGVPATASVLEHQFEEEGLRLSEPQTVIGDLLDRIRDQYAKNEQRKAFEELSDIYINNPRELPKAMLQRARELDDLLRKRGESFGTGDVTRAKYRYDKKVLAGPGPSLGFEAWDDYFFGLRGVSFFLAPPKTYKSWMIVSAAQRNILANKSVWLYSLELPCEETDMRLRCLTADVPFWHYLRNRITPDEWKLLEQASSILDSGGTYRIVKPSQGHRTIDEMFYNARDAGADLVLIDQLQYVENDKGQSVGSQNQTGVYWDVLNRARDLSDDAPVVFAHQYSRQAMFSDGVPPIEFAKGSSSIEEVATLALGFWANRDMRRSGLLRAGTAIARNHMFAAWDMEMDLTEHCTFSIIGRASDEEQET